MKLVVAMMQHETNTFAARPTRLADFGQPAGLPVPPSGAAAVAAYQDSDLPLAAFLAAAAARGADTVVPVAAYAEPGGVVEDAAFEAIAAPIVEAVRAGADAVLLDLHGAMITESHADAEGELLRRLRAVDPDMPIAVALDFHANVTAAMVEAATVITGYRTYPHVDMTETGERAARVLFQMLEGRARPVMVWDRLPLLSATLRQSPEDPPLAGPMRLARAAEAQDPAILAVSIFPGFPFADSPHTGFTAVAVADGDAAAARGLVWRILAGCWRARAGFVGEAEPLAQAVARAARLAEAAEGTGRPVVIGDYGDSPGAGGAMDDMSVLAAMRAQGLTGIAAGPIADPAALAALRAAGLGAHVTLPVGGHSPAAGESPAPLILSGRVAGLFDGRFLIDGPMMRGFPADLGGTAVLDTGDLALVVSGGRMEPYTPQVFSHAGINPTSKRFLVVKSRQHFRAAFGPLASAIVMAEGGGVCREDFARLPWRHLTRPIYPLDPDCAWPPADRIA
jgi:microcystin degradation protein MlrC